MAIRLPLAGGDMPVLAERSKNGLELEFTGVSSEAVDTVGATEAVTKHQLALQRYIFEWTAHHGRLLLMDIRRIDEEDEDDDFRLASAELLPAHPAQCPESLSRESTRCEKRTLTEQPTIEENLAPFCSQRSARWRDAAEADSLPAQPEPYDDCDAGRAPLAIPSPAAVKPWRQSAAVVVPPAMSLGNRMTRHDSTGSLPSRLPEAPRWTTRSEMPEPRESAAPFAVTRRNFSSDLFTAVSLANVYQHEPGPKSRYKIILVCEFLDESIVFQRFCSLVILANAFCLFFTIEFAIRNPSDPSYDTFQNLELSFCTFYIAELCVRLAAQKSKFITGNDVGWNIFDGLLAVSAVQEQVISAITASDQGSSGQNLSYLRILRLLKVVKLLRMIRLMRAFRELRLVLNSILGSVKALIWSFCLIAGICFMFGVCFVQGVTELAIAEGWPSCVKVNEELEGEGSYMQNAGEGSDVQNACMHWGSIGKSMMSLFQASTNGIDWEVLATPLFNAGPLYYGVFCFYIGFFLFVVMNSLTSLFVDCVISNAASDEDQIMQDQLHRKKDYMSKIVHIFSSIDADGSGAITQEEFLSHKRDPMLLAFAQSLDIEPDALDQFFGLLSCDGRRPVDLETFVVGCIRVRGAAKSIDLMDVLITQQRVAEDQAQFMDYCGEQLHTIQQALRCEVPPGSFSPVPSE